MLLYVPVFLLFRRLSHRCFTVVFFCSFDEMRKGNRAGHEVYIYIYIHLIFLLKIGKARVLKWWHVNKHFALWTFLLCLVLKKSGLVFLAFEWVSSCSCKYVFFLPFVFLSCFMFLERLFFSSFCVFTCTSSRTERWRFALGKWEWESELLKRKWIESQYDLRLFFFILFLLLAFCFLPRVLFFFWDLSSWESTCMCLENCERIHFTCNKSSNTRDKGGGWHAALLDGFVFLYYSFFSLKDHMKREWKKKKREMFWVEGGLSCWY